MKKTAWNDHTWGNAKQLKDSTAGRSRIGGADTVSRVWSSRFSYVCSTSGDLKVKQSVVASASSLNTIKSVTAERNTISETNLLQCCQQGMV